MITSPQLHDRLKKFDHIIWDWNGTLLDDVEHNVRVINQLIEGEGLAAIDVELHRSLFRFPVIEYYYDLGFDTTEENFAWLCAEFNTRYEAGLSCCRLMPEMHEVLLDLHRLGKKQSILSAAKQSSLEHALTQFGIAEKFSFIFGISDHHAASKLDRGRELLELSQIAPSRTVLIGDTDHDREVGEKLGIEVILVDHGHQSVFNQQTRSFGSKR